MTGIVKSYGSVRALDGVDFELRAGEVMALLGENGAGKSTLVKMLSGLVTPDEGTITLDGVARRPRTGKQAAALGIAVVQQEYSSVPNLSVAENIFLGGDRFPFLVSRRRLGKAARPLLAEVGLSDLDPAAPVGELGVAERQLIEIARVLARDADILLFDEPTAALSDQEIERVLSVVRRLADSGRGIIYVTHRLAEVFRIADRVTVFRGGASLPPQPAIDLDVDSVITMMLGRKLEGLFPPPATSVGDAVLEVDSLLARGLAAPVSLRVRRGQILGLTGQLGSGASATVRAIAGMTPLQGGRVSVAGKPLPLRDRAQGIAHGVAYCSADRKHDGIFGRLTIQRNLTSPWLPTVSQNGVLRGGLERVLAERAASRFALDTGRLNSTVDTLSGGNQQKVALGKWAAGDATVLLVEEPTRGVDVGARAEIYRRLRELCESGTAIVVASSDTAEVLGLCDVIGTFFRGQLVHLSERAETDAERLAHQVMHGAGENTLSA